MPFAKLRIYWNLIHHWFPLHITCALVVFVYVWIISGLSFYVEYVCNILIFRIFYFNLLFDNFSRSDFKCSSFFWQTLLFVLLRSKLTVDLISDNPYNFKDPILLETNISNFNMAMLRNYKKIIDIYVQCACVFMCLI